MRKLPFLRALFVLSTALLLAACAAPAAAPESATAPPQAASVVPATGKVVVDRSCKTDADCAVKDVGNCCGYYPACVNKDSPTDPAGVRAQCQSKGMVGVCGFPSVTSCQCRSGQCASAGSGVMPIEDPAPVPDPVK
ncbi:MAG TPA: hypothetical protein VFF96_09070 [Pseudoxanthomonas sp.]|nr:hypothetical protein [Pseudoxanthomonas sp.]